MEGEASSCSSGPTCFDTKSLVSLVQEVMRQTDTLSQQPEAELIIHNNNKTIPEIATCECKSVQQ